MKSPWIYGHNLSGNMQEQNIPRGVTSGVDWLLLNVQEAAIQPRLLYIQEENNFIYTQIKMREGWANEREGWANEM